MKSMKLIMENFKKFLEEEEDASQMPADTSTGNPKPYSEKDKKSGKLDDDVGLKISDLLKQNNPKEIEKIHAELEKAFTKDDLEFVFELGTLDEVFDDEMIEGLKNLILPSEEDEE